MPVALRQLCVAAVLVLAASAPARANSSGSLCRVEATQMAFGTYYGRAAGPHDITATISVACTVVGPVARQISFSVTPFDGASLNRDMRHDTRSMRYQLFVDAAHTIPWGDGTGGTQPLTGSGTASPTVPLHASFTLYGRVLARQKLRAGSYVDTIPIRLSW